MMTKKIEEEHVTIGINNGYEEITDNGEIIWHKPTVGVQGGVASTNCFVDVEAIETVCRNLVENFIRKSKKHRKYGVKIERFP